MGLYGWYGNLDSRGNRGELASRSGIQPIQYVEYDEAQFREAAGSTRLEFLSFSVTLQEKEPPQATTADPESPTEFPIVLVLSVSAGVVVFVLLVCLIIALVCVFGRKRNQPKNK